MILKRNIANLITLSNLLCGCLGIIYAFNMHWHAVFVLLCAALVFDFLDGFVARLLQTHSPIGKDLDSLADLVTFGVLPSMVMFHLFPTDHPWRYAAFLIALASAWRLAKFNNDPNQSDQFIGLPTPANAACIISLPLVNFAFVQVHLENPASLLLVILASSILLNAPLRLIALKFNSFGWKGNITRYIFIAGALLLLLFFKVAAIPLILILYLTLSIIDKFLNHEIQS